MVISAIAPMVGTIVGTAIVVKTTDTLLKSTRSVKGVKTPKNDSYVKRNLRSNRVKNTKSVVPKKFKF